MQNPIGRRGMLVGGAGAVLLASNARPRAEPMTAVTIALSSNSLAYGGLRIAQQLGLFAKHGLDAKIMVMDSGNAATSALVAGSVQFCSSGPGEVLSARARGLDVVLVTNLYRGTSAPVLLAKSVADKLPVGPKAPVNDRLKALDGLAIAVPSATSALLLPVKSSCEEVGSKPRFVYMAQPAMLAALEAGAIQGFIASSPFWVPPIRSGKGVIWIDAPHGELPERNSPTSVAGIEVLRSYAKANPEMVSRIRSVFTDVASVISSQPEQAMAALIKAYPSIDADTLKLAFTQDAVNWTKPVFTTADLEKEKSLLERSTDIPGVKALNAAEAVLS